MTPLTYTTLQSELATALQQWLGTIGGSMDATFLALLPGAISWTEYEISKRVSLLAVRKQDTSLATSPSTNSLDLSGMSSGVPLVVERVDLVVGSTPYPFDMVSDDALAMFWPVASATMNPSQADWIGRYATMLDDHTLLLAPTPDAAYTASILATFPPVGLSASVPSTYLSQTYPDAMFAGSMLWLTGTRLRNFGSQSDDPKMAMSWKQIFEEAVERIDSDERKRRGLAPNEPKPEAQPQG